MRAILMSIFVDVFFKVVFSNVTNNSGFGKHMTSVDLIGNQ